MHDSASLFPIVGMGASAGGLEALGLFLSHVPADSGMAFVIVQHLDPIRKGMMVELLQHSTNMTVAQVTDRTQVRPNCVYIIPPNKDMSLLHGVLHLLEPTSPHGLRLPIDFFFNSLAADQRERSIGIVLSGMGSDGSLGLRAIKEKGGLVLVQEPSSAKFDSMPRSAIDKGLADIVAPGEALPSHLIAYLQHPHQLHKSVQSLDENAHSGLQKVMILLRTQTGHDFSLYKKTTVLRRIERRMGIHQIDRIATYIRYLQENSQEIELLFQELLIGVTRFFRDPLVWEQLKADILPTLLAGHTSGQPFRVWVPACATGEEAYSLAILFKEVLEQLKPTKNISLQIFATDLDKDAISKGREGIFPAEIATDVSAERLSRFFVHVERGYQVVKSIRETVIFAPHNVLMAAPFTRLDLLSCRNLLIYLTSDLQHKLLPLFYYSLNPDGCLFLGNSESIGSFTTLFKPYNNETRLYRRLDTARQKVPVEFPTAAVSARSKAPTEMTAKPPLSLQDLTDQLLLQHHAPAAVLTDVKGNIIYVSGRTGKYLEPAAGKVNWNVFAMAREGLQYELMDAFQKVLREKESVTLKSITVGFKQSAQLVEVTLQPVGEPETLQNMILIVFKDLPTPSKIKARGKHPLLTVEATRIADLDRKLALARQEIEDIRHEMQASQEALKATDEEWQSTNEELQSTNEELTTSKEEMQSLNEELQTINHELQVKLEELSRTNNDLKNLLDSTDIATLFLDNALNVRRFNSETTRITKLIARDVGRPITDIASVLLYPELTDDARQVLRTLIPVDKQIITADGHWFGIRILPYRTLNNTIDGVVITFSDITASKTLEAALRTKEAGLKKMLDQEKLGDHE